jgi:hypothetical protein
MNVCLDIISFIDELEEYAKRKLNYPVEVGELLQIVMQTGLAREFEDLIFQAKFLVRTQEILKRTGPGTDGFEKLSIEFQSGVKKSIDCLNMLIEKAHSDIARKLTNMFIVMETDSFNRLIKLFSDLSCIKNWQVDGKLLPYQTKTAVLLDYQDRKKEKEREEKTSVPLIRIQKSALFCMIIFILFLFLDPPVTVIGWILSLGIVVFLVYIVIQIYMMNRTLEP